MQEKSGFCIFAKLYQVLLTYTKNVYSSWSLSKNYFTQKCLILCNNKHFCQKYDFMLFLLYSIKVDENKAVARTFIWRYSDGLNSLYDSDPAVGYRFGYSIENSVSFTEVSADWTACLTL